MGHLDSFEGDQRLVPRCTACHPLTGHRCQLDANHHLSAQYMAHKVAVPHPVTPRVPFNKRDADILIWNEGDDARLG